MKAKTLYRFGPYVLDADERVLLRDSQLVTLPPKDLETLLVLVERAGHIVEKEELLNRVWPGVFIEEGNLSRRIFNLRQVLGDSVDGRPYIDTIPKRGYRFVATVQKNAEADASVATQTSDLTQTAPRVQQTVGFWSRPLVLAGGLAVAAILVTLGTYWFGLRNRPAHSARPQPAMLAVLPFQNAASAADIDFLRLALADEIATELSHVPSLSIRSSATTSRYDSPNVDLKQAARDMGVTSIVTGHFLREADHLVVTLEAVDSANDRSIWRDSVEVASSDRLAMRREITARIRNGLLPALGVQSSAFETDTRPQNEQAYDLFLRSISLPHDGPPNKDAMTMLEHSVEVDPEYAPAWEALAYRYYYSAAYGEGGELMHKRSDSALERALALDPNLISATAALIENRTEEGETANAYGKASALVKRWPESAHAHFALAYVLRYAGLLEEAERECESADTLDRGNFEFRSCYIVFMLLNKPQRSADFVGLDRNSEWAARATAEILLRQGRLAEARQSIAKTSASLLMGRDLLEACLAPEKISETRSVAKRTEAVALAGADAETNYLVATLLAYCGHEDAAIRLLRGSSERNYCAYMAMQTDPLLVKVRQRPEFPRLLSSAKQCQSKFLDMRAQGGH